VPSDQHLRSALDSLLTTIRSGWNEDVRVSADDLALAAAADSRDAVEQAVQAAVTLAREAAQSELETERCRFEADAAALQQRADSRVEEVRTLLDTSERAKAGSDEALANATRELEGLRQELAGVRAELEAARNTGPAPPSPVEQARMADAGALWVLKGATRELDRAQSLGEVLDCLTRSARQIVEGTSVYLVVGDRLHEWTLTHGAADAAPNTRVWPSSAGTAGEPQEDWFAVRVGGEVVAVVLVAVAPAEEAAPSWSDTLTILTRHAGLVLEAMTLRRSAGFGLQTTHTPATSDSVPVGVSR
jgi:hypothetical protein